MRMRDEDMDDVCRCRECGDYITHESYMQDGYCTDCLTQIRTEDDAQAGVMDREEWEAFRFGDGESDIDEL